MLTPNIITFSLRNRAILAFASAISMAGFMWPFFYSGKENELPKTQLFFWFAIALSALLVLAEISSSSMDAKSIALLGVLAALIAALRPLGAGVAGIEPMWFVLILSARVFGASFGFILGLLSMFVSALITGGFGPWLGYQVFAAAWIGLAAGALPQKIGKWNLRGRSEIVLLVGASIVSALAFGVLMDLSIWPWALGMQTQLSFISGGALGENISRFIYFHFASAMAWDIPRAIFTSILVILTAPAVLTALRRTKVRAAFLTPIEFVTK